VIGGGGERLTLQVVARYADIWNIIPRSVEEFARKSAILDGYCAEIGRDPMHVLRSVQIQVESPFDDRIKENIQSYAKAGARHFVLELSPPFSPDVLRTLSKNI
jgi:hypothetical protein